MTIIGIEANIAQLLFSEQATQTYKDDTNTDMKYSWPEVQFDPSVDKKFLDVSLLMNRPTWEGINGDKVERVGLLQVSVFWPKLKGEIKPLIVASAVADAWKNKVLFGDGLKIKVSRTPWVSGPLSDQSRVQVPVNIPWVAYAA